MNWHPLRFRPIYKERVWGGRALETVYGRSLPVPGPIGESWEVSDRADDVSVVAEGPLAGRTLRDLMEVDGAGLLGSAPDRAGRFPLLVKILDAREILSLQVHPPAARARALGGEPKTEMWYFTSAAPGARILAGLRPGTTRGEFERRLGEGTVADCFHAAPVRAGDAMFLPSGRVHALGAGLVLFEIQENSDTTYRVFDWNRAGLDGRPRALHVRESLESIDFGDFAPALVAAPWCASGPWERRALVEDPLFRVSAWRAPGTPASAGWEWDRCRIVAGVRGRLEVRVSGVGWPVGPGDFLVLPAALRAGEVLAGNDAEWLVAEPGGTR